MPIRPHHRWLYPIDWRELSASIRFRRAQGRCETCGRPHGRVVLHLGDGRWWDDEAHRWRDGAGKWVRRLKPPHSLLERTRTTRVVLATAHRDHDPTNNDTRASMLAASRVTSFSTCLSTSSIDVRPTVERRALMVCSQGAVWVREAANLASKLNIF